MRALNNPDAEGLFRAVGVGSETGVVPVVWEVTVEGTVLGMAPLIEAGGENFYATDINDLDVMAGFVLRRRADACDRGFRRRWSSARLASSQS